MGLALKTLGPSVDRDRGARSVKLLKRSQRMKDLGVIVAWFGGEVIPGQALYRMHLVDTYVSWSGSGTINGNALPPL